MKPATTVHMRLYLQDVMAPIPTKKLIAAVTPDEPNQPTVSVWWFFHPVLPYVDIQYGMMGSPINHFRRLWGVLGEQSLQALFARFTVYGQTDRLYSRQHHGDTSTPISFNDSTVTCSYFFDRVQVKWGGTSPSQRTTTLRLSQPGRYVAHNQRYTPTTGKRTYGTSTTAINGQPITTAAFLDSVIQQAGVLRGEGISPNITESVSLYYHGHLVRKLETVQPVGGQPYWVEYAMDDWFNITAAFWRAFHEDYCGAAPQPFAFNGAPSDLYMG